MTDVTTDWELPIEQIMSSNRERIDNEDFVSAYVEVWRKGDPGPCWTVFIGETGDYMERDVGLHALKVMSAFADCDYLLFSFDTHATSLLLNPNTGEKWKQGEMQAMCDQQGFCETGQMRDNLVVAIVRKSDQKIRYEGIPYHFHKGELMIYDDGTVINEWEENSGVVSMLGTVPEGMRYAASIGPVSDLMKEAGLNIDDFGLTPEAARQHQIMAGVQTLARMGLEMGHPMMFMSALPVFNDEMAEIIDKSAERSGLDAKAMHRTETGEVVFDEDTKSGD